MKTVYKTQYFNIIETIVKGQKTKFYDIINNKFERIGSIKWQGSFRKYAFFPAADTVWDNKCLEEVLDVLNDINKKYREGE